MPNYSVFLLSFSFLCFPTLAFQGIALDSSLRFQPDTSNRRLVQQSLPISGALSSRGPPLPQRKMSHSEESIPSTSTTDSNGIVRSVLHAVGATTSLVVSWLFFVALAYQRDALMVSFFIGSIGNAIAGKILKRVLNQERPAELETVDMKLKPGDKGMPSSHAMSLGFIGTFTGLSLPWTQIPILLYSIVSLWYRVDIKLHTVPQILVGFVVGSTNGAIWRFLCDGRNPWGINVMSLVSQTMLNDDGLLPITLLLVPALVGAIVVGSVERRLAGWLEKIKGE
jgi:membrane-associated phospholipid phosphatase